MFDTFAGDIDFDRDSLPSEATKYVNEKMSEDPELVILQEKKTDQSLDKLKGKVLTKRKVTETKRNDYIKKEAVKFDLNKDDKEGELNILKNKKMDAVLIPYEVTYNQPKLNSFENFFNCFTFSVIQFFT